MGKKDILLNDFMSNPHIFADLINGCCFHGKRMIRPEELLPLDSVQPTKSNQGVYSKQFRDIKKLLFCRAPAAILAVENQEHRDFRMPVRCMRYDADEYGRQIKAIMAEHKAEKGMSCFAETDFLLPVLSLVIYYGKEEWTHPENIHDMLDFSRIPESLRHEIPNYPIRIYSVRKDIDIDLFCTELREVMGILQRVDDKNAMKQFFYENRDAFSKMTEAGFEVIITCTNSRKLRKYMSDNLEGGIMDMCKAFDEWMDDCREEGIKKGESRFALLIQKLAEENRMSEILRAAENAALRKRLYKKYGL